MQLLKNKPRRARLFVGRKTLEWMRVRAKLKRKFAAMGITECEVGYDGCWKDNALSFAHGKRRRHLVDNEIEDLVVISCTPCHERLDRLPPAATLAIVESIISEREIHENR